MPGRKLREYILMKKRGHQFEVAIEHIPAANAHSRLRRALDLILRAATRAEQGTMDKDIMLNGRRSEREEQASDGNPHQEGGSAG